MKRGIRVDGSLKLYVIVKILLTVPGLFTLNHQDTYV